MSWLRAVMLLALIVWIGGIIFFAFVEAPTLFSVLPSPRMAGDIVSPTLSKLHWLGIISAIAFLSSSILYDRVKLARFKPFGLSNVLAFLMLVLTLISQFGIATRMRQLRAEMQISDLPIPMGVQRAEFDRLHAWSTRLEGGVLFLGLGVVILTARRFS